MCGSTCVMWVWECMSYVVRDCMSYVCVGVHELCVCLSA